MKRQKEEQQKQSSTTPPLPPTTDADVVELSEDGSFDISSGKEDCSVMATTEPAVDKKAGTEEEEEEDNTPPRKHCLLVPIRARLSLVFLIPHC